MLLSTELAMLPAGHQMMERLRVRLLCSIIILAVLASLTLSSKKGGCTGNYASTAIFNISYLCRGHAGQGMYDMLATLPFLDGQGAAACLHDIDRMSRSSATDMSQCRQSSTASRLHLPRLRHCPVSAGAAAMPWAALQLMLAAGARRVLQSDAQQACMSLLTCRHQHHNMPCHGAVSGSVEVRITVDRQSHPL